MNQHDQIQEFLTRGVENIYPSRAELEKTLRSGRKLTIYNGIDPTAPTLHIGHGSVLLKLRELQNMGHKIILLIGDFTGMIGDPTDKSAARKQLTREEVKQNMKQYTKQAGKILDIKRVEVKYNSQWLAKLKPVDILQLASEFTVPQMLARDMFKRRTAEGKDIFLHEFLYPLMQGYDSVAMNVDMEIGGNDQTFNMLVGRDMMKRRGKEKFVLTTKLLVDATGKKMGKTEGNMVTLADAPEEMYGKVMSWPDTLMPLAFEICTRIPMDDVARLLQGDPRDAKMRLAREIVAMYHSEKSAREAEENFVRMFQKHEAPKEISGVKFQESAVSILDLLVRTKLASSKSEARRLVEQKGVKVDERVVEDPDAVIEISKDGVLIQKGKRHFVRAMR